MASYCCILQEQGFGEIPFKVLYRTTICKHHSKFSDLSSFDVCYLICSRGQILILHSTFTRGQLNFVRLLHEKAEHSKQGHCSQIMR